MTFVSAIFDIFIQAHTTDLKYTIPHELNTAEIVVRLLMDRVIDQHYIKIGSGGYLNLFS